MGIRYVQFPPWLSAQVAIFGVPPPRACRSWRVLWGCDLASSGWTIFQGVEFVSPKNIWGGLVRDIIEPDGTESIHNWLRNQLRIDFVPVRLYYVDEIGSCIWWLSILYLKIVIISRRTWIELGGGLHLLQYLNVLYTCTNILKCSKSCGFDSSTFFSWIASITNNCYFNAICLLVFCRGFALWCGGVALRWIAALVCVGMDSCW